MMDVFEWVVCVYGNGVLMVCYGGVVVWCDFVVYGLCVFCMEFV